MVALLNPCVRLDREPLTSDMRRTCHGRTFLGGKNKKARGIAFLTATVTSAFFATHAFATDDAQAALLAEAKVTKAQAKTMTLSKTPEGTVKSAELEREHGRPVWSFDIARPSVKGVTEIQVDANPERLFR